MISLKYLQIVGVAENSKDVPKALLAYICQKIVDMKRPSMNRLDNPQSCTSPVDSEPP